MKLAYLAVALLPLMPAPLCHGGNIPWMSDLQQAQRVATEQQRLVMVHFTAESCGPCRMLERGVYSRPEFQRALLANYIPVKIDVPSNPELVKRFQVRSWPTDVFLTAAGKVIFRDVSPQNLNRYISRVDQIAAHARVGMNPTVAANMNPGHRAPQAGGPLPADPRFADNSPAIERASQFIPPGPRQGFAATAPTSVATRQPVRNQFMPNQPMGTTSSPAEQQQVASVDNPYVREQQPQPTSPAGQHGNHAVPVGVPQNHPGDLAQQPAPTSPSATTNDANQPQLALEGFCPVALLENKSWSLGYAKWGHIHRGKLYLFSSEEAKAKFWSDPDRFSPVMSGYDIVQYLEAQHLQHGARQFGSYYRNKYYLFSSEATLLKFESSPDYYADKANLAIAEHDRAVMRR